MVGGQAAAAEPVEEDGDAERLGQRPQLALAVAPVEAGAGHDHRALGGGEQRRRLLHPARPGAPRCDGGGSGTSGSASVKTTSSG